MCGIGGTRRRGYKAGGGLCGGERRAEREATAAAVGDHHDSGGEAGIVMRKQLAGAAHARWHLSQNQQRAMRQ